MESNEKPRVRYVQELPPKVPMGTRAAKATSKHAEGLGYLVAITVPWVATSFIPVDIPEPILSAFSGWAVGEAVRLRERIFD